MNTISTSSPSGNRLLCFYNGGTNGGVSITSLIDNSIVNQTQVELNHAETDAREDGLDVCRESICDAHDFIRDILPILGIKPSYIDIHPDGKIAFMWHIRNKAISGLSFEGREQIIWNYYLRKSEQRNQGTMNAKDFLSSDLCKILKENFS